MSRAQVLPVTDNVWCIRRPSYLTCSYIVRTPLGIVLVDAGMDSSGADVYQGLQVANATPRDVSAILLTHWHNDHAAGTRAIQNETGVPAYCHQADAPQLTRQTARHGLRGILSDLIPERGILVLLKGLLGEATPRAILNPRLVDDGCVLEEYFEVLATPGHTPGHLSFVYKPHRILFSGDALAIVQNEIRFMARPVTPDLETARQSMQRCLALDLNIICPGHRTPLTQNVRHKCQGMMARLERDEQWPFLG